MPNRFQARRMATMWSCNSIPASSTKKTRWRPSHSCKKRTASGKPRDTTSSRLDLFSKKRHQRLSIRFNSCDNSRNWIQPRLSKMDMKRYDDPDRCPWVDLTKSEYVESHDKEWGVPVHDDNVIIECLRLERAQALLTWYTVLPKRNAYGKA